MTDEDHFRDSRVYKEGFDIGVGQASAQIMVRNSSLDQTHSKIGKYTITACEWYFRSRQDWLNKEAHTFCCGCR